MNGYYIGVMGMLKSQNDISARSNNIANSNTTGYKFDDMVSEVFETKAAYRNAEDREYIGGFSNKVVDVGTWVNLGQGATEMTGRTLDLAMVDQEVGSTSFFVVNKDNKNYLTRNGEFEVNADGHLRTMTGEFVLDQNNRKIKIDNPDSVSVSSNGVVSDSVTGVVYARLNVKMVTKENRELLEKNESVLFDYRGNIDDLPEGTGKINQSMLERSNVDLSSEIMELMNSQRRFQANSKTYSVFDKIYDKEANQLMK